MSWISPRALLRNALIAAGNRRDPSLQAAVGRHADASDTMIAGTARWALSRIA
jgi:epoxyqueuosine reductase QueG